MKKYNKLLLVIALALYVPFSAIYDVKASTSLFNATSGTIDNYDNTRIGRYNVYTATATNSNLQFYFMDQFFDYDQFKSASITDIQLNDSYDEYMTIIYGSNVNDDLVWVESDGSALLHINQRAVNLTLNDVSWVRIFVVSTDTTSNNIQPTSISPTLTKSSFDVNLDPVLNNQIIQRWFPQYNMVGYLWSISYGAFTNLGDTEIPWVYIPTSGNDNAYTQNHRLIIGKGHVYEFYFLCTWWLTNDRIKLLNQNANTNYTYNIEVIQQFASDSSSTHYTRYLHKLTIDATNNTGGQSIEIEFLGNVWCYPFYYGCDHMIPDDLALLMNTPYSNTYTDLLKIIADNVSGTPSQADQDFIDDITTTVSDYTTSETTIHDFFDTSMNDIDLDDYSIPASLAATTQWLVSQMEDIFYEVPDLRILFVLPLVLGISLFFIGRGSVIFRQGNIDRAREIAYGDAVSAEIAKDKIDGEAFMGASTKFGNNMKRMEQHHTHTFGYHERNSK